MSCRFREKHKNAPLIPKNDVTEPKATATLITTYKLLTGCKSVSDFRKLKLTLTC